MNVTEKIENGMRGVNAAYEYINRSQEAYKRSLRPVAMIPSWGLVKRLGGAFTRKGEPISQIGRRLSIMQLVDEVTKDLLSKNLHISFVAMGSSEKDEQK